MKQKTFFIIAGPTGVGKTDFSLRLARAISGEIINADMGQLYQPLTIGTAKPDWRSSDIAHHLFDIIETPTNYTVVDYRNRVIPLLEQIWERNNVPILVGGSHFYLQSLLFPPHDLEIDRRNTIPFDKSLDSHKLWQELSAIDPLRASQIHENDTYRLQRALIIYKKTGQKPSSYKPLYNPYAPYSFIFLTRDREELYDRINKRVDDMIQNGWIEEVAALRPWWQFLKEKKIIGYNDIIDYLNQENSSKEDLITLTEAIAQKTRNYAKRQLIFWKMQKKILDDKIGDKSNSRIITLNLTLSDLDLYIKQLLSNVLFE